MISSKISKYLIISLLGFVIILLPSCKTTSKIKKSQSGITHDSIIEKLLNPPLINSYKAKAKLTYEDKSGSQKANLYIRSIKDSLIWMAVKKYSTEAGRALITKDSIFLINRLEKKYYCNAIENIESEYGMYSEFNYIQDMIHGIPPEIDSSKAWEVYTNKNKLVINTSISDILHNFSYDLNSGLIVSGQFRNNDNLNGTWIYDDYRIIGDRFEIPFFRYFNFQLNGNESLILKLEFSNVEIDLENSIRFEIPSHYQKVE